MHRESRTGPFEAPCLAGEMDEGSELQAAPARPPLSLSWGAPAVDFLGGTGGWCRVRRKGACEGAG